MKTALLSIAVIAGLLAVVLGLNALIVRSTGPSKAEVTAAQAYAARHAPHYRLHSCRGSSSDRTRILCDSGAQEIRVDFDVDDHVVRLCVVGRPDCDWAP